MAANESESIPLNLRVPIATRDRLDVLAERLPFSRHKLAVLALALGVAAIERDPTVLVAGAKVRQRR